MTKEQALLDIAASGVKPGQLANFLSTVQGKVEGTVERRFYPVLES